MCDNVIRSDYYVYALFGVNGLPFYIGKGRKGRWCNHVQRAIAGRSLKDDMIIETISVLGEVPKVKIAQNLTNEKACEIECAFISVLGRIPDGILTNISAGGVATQGMAGRQHTEETRQRMSGSAKGRAMSPEARMKMSQSKAGRKRGARPPEVCAAISAAQKGRKFTDEHKIKLSLARRAVIVNTKGTELSIG